MEDYYNYAVMIIINQGQKASKAYHFMQVKRFADNLYVMMYVTGKMFIKTVIILYETC